MKALLLVCALISAAIIACGGSGNSNGEQRTVGASVRFQPDATEEQVAAVDAYLRSLDPELELFTIDTLPPIFSATMTVDEAVSCTTLTAELQSRTYVSEVECVERDVPAPTDSPTSG